MDIQDDPYRVAGPGELIEDHADYDEHYDDDDLLPPPVLPQPMAPATFLGDARQMQIGEWIAINSIHLRERWRHILDSCIVLQMEMPEEADYVEWCLIHFEQEQRRQDYLEAIP